MAVLLQMTYSKKLGLPNFSSHCCSVSLQVEIADVNQVADESNKLYQLLQSSVDQEIQQVGFMPDATKYGMNGNSSNGHSTNGNHRNGQSNGHHQNGYSNGHSNGHQNGRSNHELAGISDKQLDLINNIVRQNNLNKADIENLSVDLFGGGVRTLNKMQASNFIDELFERYPKQTNGQRSFQSTRA